MRSAAIVVLAACAAPTARVAESPPSPAAAADTPPQWLPETAASPRPSIDISQWVPDVEAEARWPLGFNEHPEAEPSFDIASALADPGVTWRELCARGVQFGHRANDQDRIAYLKLWCTEDPADALYQLGLLRDSAIRGIADAIVPDSARIVVGHMSADVAEGMLTRAGLADTAIFDTVAASYLEVGKLDDALAMNRVAAESDRTLDDATKCHRLVRAIVSTGGHAQHVFSEELHTLATPRDVPTGYKALPRDPTCLALDHDVRCWRTPSVACIGAAAGNPKLEALMIAYGRWPKHEAEFSKWRKQVDDAARAMPGDEAFALLSRALELAIVTTQCDHTRLGAIARKLDELRTLDGPTSPYDAQLDRLLARAKQLAGVPYARCAEALRSR